MFIHRHPSSVSNSLSLVGSSMSDKPLPISSFPSSYTETKESHSIISNKMPFGSRIPIIHATSAHSETPISGSANEVRSATAVENVNILSNTEAEVDALTDLLMQNLGGGKKKDKTQNQQKSIIEKRKTPTAVENKICLKNRLPSSEKNSSSTTASSIDHHNVISKRRLSSADDKTPDSIRVVSEERTSELPENVPSNKTTTYDEYGGVGRQNTMGSAALLVANRYNKSNNNTNAAGVAQHYNRKAAMVENCQPNNSTSSSPPLVGSLTSSQSSSMHLDASSTMKKNYFFGSCRGCSGRIVGEGSGVYVLGHIYHNACFVCYQCRISLYSKNSYAVGGKPVCEECYLKSLQRCTSCHQPITERLLRATGNPYHPECFICIVCRCKLDGIPFTVDATNEIYCVRDFHEKFAPHCGRCNAPIMPNSPTVNKRTHKQQPNDTDESFEGGLIAPEAMRIVALDKSYHLGCYRCEDCNADLTGRTPREKTSSKVGRSSNKQGTASPDSSKGSPDKQSSSPSSSSSATSTSAKTSSSKQQRQLLNNDDNDSATVDGKQHESSTYYPPKTCFPLNGHLFCHECYAKRCNDEDGTMNMMMMTTTTMNNDTTNSNIRRDENATGERRFPTAIVNSIARQQRRLSDGKAELRQQGNSLLMTLS